MQTGERAPARESDAGDDPERLPGQQRAPRHPVLVVDDYADARATLREMLEDCGLDVVEAVDGQEAFNFLVFNPEVNVRLILLDLDMPRMNGFDFLTLVKSYLRLSAIPVVVVSRQTGDMPQAQRLAINGAFQVPYDLSRLRAVVEALVSH